MKDPVYWVEKGFLSCLKVKANVSGPMIGSFPSPGALMLIYITFEPFLAHV